MKVLVVDDEALARRRLTRLLAELENVELVGEADNGVEALALVEDTDPDLVFLDIRMPAMDGLTVARRISGSTPVVFTTAYDEHAVDAFDINAVDYLLKPVRRERLERGLARVRDRRSAAPEQVRGALERLLDPAAVARAARLTAQDGGALYVFDARQITRFHASEKYTCFTHDGREFLLDQSLSTLETRLGPLGYLRVHRGELIGLDHVRCLRTDDGGAVLELTDGQRARVSRRYLPGVKRALGA